MYKKILIIVIILITYKQHILSETFLKWGYVVDYTTYTKKYLYSLKTYTSLSMTGFKIKSNAVLNIPSYKKLYKIKNFCKSYNKEFIPLIHFTSAKTGEKILNKTKLRNKLVDSITKLVKKNKYKRIHLDFEYLNKKYIYKLIDFLILLKKKNKKIIINMAIFPQYKFNKQYAKFHDISILNSYIDEIVLMCYDYHNKNTKPGPVTDLDWTEKNIKYILKYLNRKKVILGIPAYGYAWTKNSKVKVVSAKSLSNKKNKFNYKRDRSGCLYYEQIINNKNYIVYCSDKIMRLKMHKLAMKYKLKGTAIWRLGLED